MPEQEPPLFDAEPTGFLARLRDEVGALFLPIDGAFRERLCESVFRWAQAHVSRPRECVPGSRCSRVRENESVDFVEFNEVEFFPEDDLSGDARLARVAALHDHFYRNTPIVPLNFLPAEEGFAYWVLVNRVGRELSEESHGQQLAALLMWFTRFIASYMAEHTPPATPARHSVDFRSVHWYGSDYPFTPMQAPIVKALWKAFENDTPDVGEETLLVEVDAQSSRLVDVFRGSAAWGTMIQAGETKGSRRLVVPQT